MTHPDIPALEAFSRDTSETPRRVLFVLGSGQSPAVEVFEAAARQRSTSIDPRHLEEMAAGRRRSLALSTPMQMVPDIVRSLVHSNVAVYQVQLLSPLRGGPAGHPKCAAAGLKKSSLLRLSLLLLAGSAACWLAYRLNGVRVDADGLLREAFPLIPIGYLLGGAGIASGIAGLLWRKPASSRGNSGSTGE
jgi:hypothetical protein